LIAKWVFQGLLQVATSDTLLGLPTNCMVTLFLHCYVDVKMKLFGCLADDATCKLAADTLEELEWCLEQLETIQTHRSVSDMATSKVKMTY
jgi:hypothetical protein